MKFLRLLYMLIGWIAFLPVMIIVFTGLFIFMYKKTHNAKTAGKVCWTYFRNGIEMNLDFIKNGLSGT